ncbi:MAG: LicD family protein [Clostridia bacterium]|nr:LicD family protein [Clostridia bacterium]
MNIVDIKRKLRKNKLVNNIVKQYYSSKHKKQVLLLQKNGYQTNEEIFSCLAGKLEYMAWAGTLLGVIRENGFIKGDDDLDYCVRAETQSDWNLLYKVLTNQGYKLKHYFKYNGTITEMAFMKDGLSVDFFGLLPFEKGSSVIIFYRDPSEKYGSHEASCIRIVFTPYTSLSERRIHNSTFYVPDNYSHLLEANYGPGWTTPQTVSYTQALGSRRFMPDEHGTIGYRWND